MTLTNNSITHEQRKKIFALSREAHLSNEELHFYMDEWANTTSLSGNSCTGSQAKKIIESLQTVINIRKTKYVDSTDRKGTITEKQIHAITTLKKILKWHDGRINGFIGHTVGKNTVNELSVKEASQVIVGLRKMIPMKPSITTHNENCVISY